MADGRLRESHALGDFPLTQFMLGGEVVCDSGTQRR
jgi:hypothetical protein